jgi:charged multivesicular body protein 7
VKTYESSSATLRALLAHPSLQRDAVERTFDALADANADARELDEAVRSGMDVALGVDVSPDDEDEIKAELAALETEAKADALIKEEDTRQQPVAIMAATRRESVSESDAAAQRSPEQIDTRDLADAPSERRPASEQVLAE